uniref:GNAT family N-acetyltransferase n=1 Tax=Intrasporangium sp. TaxID=1925024 RepID=UPI00322215F1
MDQAELYGVLAGLRDIGAVLLEVRAMPAAAPASAATLPVLAHPLRTRRLTLRPPTSRDDDATWAFRRLREVNEWQAGCSADIAAYRALFADPVRLASTVVVQLGQQQAGTVIGDFMLRREDGWAQHEVAAQARGAQAELGWVLDPAYTGHDFATEALRALLRYSFETLGVHRVVASCFLENEASWRLMERAGMRRESHAVRESLHR